MRKLPWVVMVLCLVVGAALPAVEERSFVVPPKTFPTNHGATLVELPDREWLTCWFAGSREAGRDVQIICSRRRDGQSWSGPFVAVRSGEWASGSVFSNKFVGNPVLLYDDEGFLWLFYEAVQVGGHSGAFVDYKVSSDRGKTWSVSRRLAGGLTDFGHLPRNHALRIGANRFLLPVYREFTSKYGYVFDLSFSRGKILRQTTSRIPGGEHIQPSLVQVNPRRVAAYLRNTRKESRGRRVLVAFLDLESGRWTSPIATSLPNPNAAVDAVTDTEGRTLLIYNDSETQRAPLSVARSVDNVTFAKLFDLEVEPGNFAYPSVVHGTDGNIHVVYSYHRDTIRYVRFAP